MIADAYSARRTFNDGVKINFVSTEKLFNIYKAHPEYFVLNGAGAYTNRVNSSKLLQETISAAYVRGDIKALDNRLWLVAGVRFERTADKGRGAHTGNAAWMSLGESSCRSSHTPRRSAKAAPTPGSSGKDSSSATTPKRVKVGVALWRVGGT